ncbi:MAG: hypothetical protein ACK2VD_25430 [Anaerolineae bacterium]
MVMIAVRSVWGIAWRSSLVALGYIAGLVVAGVIGGLLGFQVSSDQSSSVSFAWLSLSALLLGWFLGPLAVRLALARWQHFALWASVIFFNLGAVAIEGAYFVPGLVPLPIPVLLVQQALAAAGAALAIMVLFAAPGQPISWWTALRQRPWHAWVWRFAVSAGSYVVLYYAFGALNYALVTQPYYASHAGGLSTPPPGQVIVAELVRAPLLMLSVLLFVLSARMPRRRLMVVTGMLLFAIGGIVPLVMQISSLPMLLLAASTVEIFCQNFGAGLVATDLLGARN